MASSTDNQRRLTLTVSFSLLSNERFTVKFPSNDIIERVLKTIPGSLYDSERAKWSFPLSSYNDCKRQLQNIQDLNVEIRPLPDYIIKIFIQQPRVNVDYKSIDVSKIHDTLLSNLCPFQKEGVQFGISKNGRCIIADEIGLSKAIQALGIAHYYYSDWPLLIICPSAMRCQWKEEIRNNLPDIPVTRIVVQTKAKEKLKDPLVLITSYDLMAKTVDKLKELKFGVIIADESSSMKNLETNRTEAGLKLTASAKRCILLNGTSPLSKPYEWFTQIIALEPNIFSGVTRKGARFQFGLRYCDGKQNRFGWDFNGVSNIDELRVLLEEKYMIRRLKSDVLGQLPKKIRQTVILSKESIGAPTEVMNELANKLNDETLESTEKGKVLSSYFAETAKIKLKAIKDYICVLLETGNKFLVFAYHKTVLDEICKLLEEKQTLYIRIDSSAGSDEHKTKRVCEQFQSEEKFRVAVLSITAASTGIKLTAANIVVFAELYYEPEILVQAEDRVHRIGRTDTVLVQYLFASGTIDDYLWTLVESRLETFDRAGFCVSCERTTPPPLSNMDQRRFDDLFDDLQISDAELNQDEETESEMDQS